MVLKNRYDQPVDIDKSVAFDGMTALPIYDGLQVTESLPTRELDYKTDGSVLNISEPVVFEHIEDVDAFAVRPDYADKRAENIQISQLSGVEEIGFHNASGISPQILWDERLINFPNPIKVNGRLKGRISNTVPSGGGNYNINLIFWRGEMDSSNYDFTSYGTIIEIFSIFSIDIGPTPIEFDHIFSEYSWIPLDNGSDGIYQFLDVAGGNNNSQTFTIEFDPETFFTAETTKAVPATDTEAYLIHETLSHVAESITNGCARVKSSYYGRTDSQPFNFPADGCGGLRFLTSGLKIRNAANPTFFASLQDLIQGLQAIDNIGMGIEPADDLQGGYLLRIEDLDYFYRDQEILRCEAINEGSYTLDASRFYSIIKIGYQKWETQANFGLDEYNSNRQYRTSLESVSNTLDKISKLVAGEYAIEITREQQYVETNSADTTYDDEIFIICLKRNNIYGSVYGGLVVEQGGIDSPLNIFSPDSTYNYRISPARNLMRWFRSIVPSYPNLIDSDNKIFFASGVGNILASGKLADNYIDTCDMEGVPIAENQDISISQFKDQAKATPLWSNDIFTFDYPLSLSDYMKIKANPYGYISFQCGLGQFEKGYIKELKYKPVDGKANFILRKKWQT
jgi:hypothetical protein